MQALRIQVGDEDEILGRPHDLSEPWGLFVRKDGFQGWGGLPAGRREALARAVQHGEHDTPVYLPSRLLTIDGWAIAPTSEELLHKLARVAGMGADGTKTPVTVTQWDSDPQTAVGRRILAVADDVGRRRGRRYEAPFQLQFVFADPRKYGAENRAPKAGAATTIDVVSYGNFPAFSVVEIPDAPADYTITSPGGVFTVSAATPGGTHQVHLRSGRVYRNGVEMPDVGHGDLWTVPAGPGWAHTLSVPGVIFTPDTFA